MKLCYVDSRRKTEIITTHIPYFPTGQPWCESSFVNNPQYKISYTEGENPTCKKCQKLFAQWLPEVKRVSAIVKETYPNIWDKADKHRRERLNEENKKQLNEGTE